MPFLLMLFLPLACLPETWSPPPGDWITSPELSVILTWVAAAVAVFFAATISRRAFRGLETNQPSRDTVVRRYSRGRFWHLLGMLIGFLLTLYVLGYGWAVQHLWRHEGQPLPLMELLLLAPLLLGLVGSWLCFYDAERAFWNESRFEGEEPGRTFWSRSGYLLFQLRQNFGLVLVPLLLLIGEKELRRQLPDLAVDWQVPVSIGGVVVALTVFIAMPWILKLLWGLKPMPPGPLRDRLLATARRLNFRFSNILIWNTRSGVANAMIVGIVPFLRYVLLSDRLIEDLSEDEVEAVFGHEVGHVKHHHMLLYLVFLLTSIAVILLAITINQEQLEEFFNLRDRADWAMVPVMLSLAAYIFLVFGFLSRRCERQADIYGCRAVSCAEMSCAGHEQGVALAEVGRGLCPTGIQVFIRALEKVGVLNGIHREKPGWLQSWQHSTIARRVHFLRGLLTDPKAERRFQRRVLLLKCGLFAALGTLFLVQIL